MRLLPRRSVLTVAAGVLAVLAGLSPLTGDDGFPPLEKDLLRLPDGGILRVGRNAAGAVDFIEFSGSEKWLLHSRDPWSRWERLRHLEELLVIQTDVTTPMTSYIASLPSVTALTITGDTVLPGETLAPLAKMKGLQNLVVDANPIGGVEIRPEHWDFLPELTALRTLSLHSLSLGKAELTFPTPCHLEWVNLGGVSETTARNLGQWDGLRNGYFSGVEAPATLLESLTHHPNLQSLSIDHADLQHADFEHLSKLRAIEDLALDMKLLRSVRFLSEMKSLETLRLRYRTDADSEAGELLEPLKKLRELSIVTEDIRGIAAVEHLIRSPSLEGLRCVANLRAVSSLDSLRGHPALKEVRLGDELRPEQLPVLATMPKLEILVVMNLPGSRWFREATVALPKVRIHSAALKSAGGDGASLWIGDWLPPPPAEVKAQ